MNAMFGVLPLLWCCFTARHGAFRLVTALLRFVDAARVWLLTTTRMTGTMATNGLAGQTNAVNPRLVAALITSLLHSKLFVCSVFVLFLLASSMHAMCGAFALLWSYFTARHGASCHVAARLRFVGAAAVCGASRVWLFAMMRMNGTMATNGLRDERMQLCHGWWRLLEHRV